MLIIKSRFCRLNIRVKHPTMRTLLIILLLISFKGYSQVKSFRVAPNGDTLNRIDNNDLKQGRWVNRFETVRGEPGFEEQGEYRNNKKEGKWTLFSLMGDVIGTEQYQWGNKDGTCLYYNNQGELVREESWKAFNPAHKADTIMVEDVDKPGTYVQKVIKHEGAAVRHGEWRIYESGSGRIVKKEVYYLGTLEDKVNNALTAPVQKKETPKPKEVLDFEKKNQGKKKIQVRDGRTGG